MLVLLLAYFGGVLTILSPCILPVLPFVFARADRPFLANGLPMLLGMAATFALVATLTAVAGEWAGAANSAGRGLALAVMGLFALMLLLPRLAAPLTRPLVALGERLNARHEGRGGLVASLVLGVATGLLWAPCAGPILGLVLTGAALSGASVQTAFLLFAYAAGAATSLALALLVGGRVFAAMKRGLGAGETLRRLLGLLVLGGVGAIALGLDTRVLATLSAGQTFQLENRLARLLGMDAPELTTEIDGPLPVEGGFPGLPGATGWINSPPLAAADLAGKVVLVDFWTYSCINCIRAVPYVRAWYERYADDGFVVVGVHTPEFAFERRRANLERAVVDARIAYPVALDNDWSIWRAFDNRYWPAHYLIDARGRIRYHHFGEGSYDKTEAAIRALLAEAGTADLGARTRAPELSATERQADFALVDSPETYLGSRRTENFASPEGLVTGAPAAFTLPAELALNHWALGGRWTIAPRRSVAQARAATIAFTFKARDLNLVLGSTDGRPIGFTVRIDGARPGADAGVDTDADGRGEVREERLYQLVRQAGAPRARHFTITFDRPGAAAYAFTFG
ncbi:cytochrome c biogenesis protein DipZ [Sphingomicrobium astaxanthinifaciens]|uniref:cytochrome c biogenesis protein DipZ n=1 Tax=Sphingomicrobium astaxanthinifaciens TaxID=1227949 RepID=UPI001FCBDCE3|nr:cytochrome c biogenesis protein DipZ [Sphingomicrobium astaxanthinifaciens]MCJ7420558.1 cytochrome c biogenesis protein DipZ [Sphingomicrobium astaxanthinifaciens]